MNHDTVNYVSPCGIYCVACPKYRDRCSCRGCRLDVRHDNCDIYDCCITLGGKQFCYECEYFPCERLREFSRFNQGRNFAHFRHIIIDNLRRIRDIGLDKWIEDINKKTLTEEYSINRKNGEGKLDLTECPCAHKKHPS